MNFADWYTDTVDIYRNTEVKSGNLTHHERTLVKQSVPCRIYHTDNKAISMKQTAADVQQGEMLACDNSVDIRPGDELLITRGGRIGKTREKIRAFAADPNYYYEPFGAVIPGLAHQQIKLLQQERVQ